MTDATAGRDTRSKHAQVRDLLLDKMQPDEIADPDPEMGAEGDQADVPEPEGLDESQELEAEGSEQGTESEGEQGETPDIRTIADLAKAIDVDPEFIYGLELNLSEELGSMPLGQVKDRIQDTAKVDAMRAQLEQERNLINQQAEQQKQQLAVQLQTVQELPQALQQADAAVVALQMQYHDENYWKQLEEQDPGRMAAEKQRVMDQYHSAVDQAQTMRGQYQQHVQQYEQQRRQQEEVNMLNAIPEWRDPTVRESETTELQKLLGEFGYSTEEIAHVVDHRQVKLLRELHRLRQTAGSADANAKKVRKVPKTLQPGARRPPPGKQVQLAKIIKNARESRDLRAKERAIDAVLRASRG